MLSGIDAIPTSVLLVEDNPADVRLVKESLREYSAEIHLTVAVDGERALQLLTDGSLQPDLVILDLNLPKINGFTVLEQYTLRTGPIVVFSTTRDPSDIQKALKLGATEVVHKPSEVIAFMNAIHTIVKKFCI